ncbi:5-hydroxytryptamine receptor 1A-beta-like [Ostrea edulis]|uniref:5-hydroxytryptamine receptor 1A-beta-like n=1 Tax=Ostrea edulis TaxID=37623 RepID=UPI002095EAF8|nr:5-hydroxytryptamine receptor 1A-beta-like [Ostrea edulis]
MHINFLFAMRFVAMGNDTDYQSLLLERYSDISLSSSILIVIGAVIGIIGNSTIVIFYLFRIKERGERYFIPLLAIVDLVACFTSPPFYIMDNTFFYNYPNDAACRVLSFLQTCVPGASAHVLLIISIQRYLLVCKPFGPKMTLFWKRILFALACGFAVLYSAPLLATSGVLQTVDTFMNHNVTTEICKFSVDTSPRITAYFGLLALIMVANLVVTAGLYAPVLKQVKHSFRSKLKVIEKSKETNPISETESSNVTQSTETEIGSVEHIKERKESRPIKLSEIKYNSNKKVHHETTQESSDATSKNYLHHKGPDNQDENTENKHSKCKGESVQRRITIMFLVIIIAYVLSYIPPLVILILSYAIEDFNFITLSEGQTVAWIYLARFIFLNHIVNPFIYGYFDAKFREQLQKHFRKWKACLICHFKG